MQRAAAILLVIYSGFMLGAAPCCRIHDFTGSVPRAAEGAHARGPGQFVCPCCEKPVNHDDGKPIPRFGKRCTCPPLIGSIAADSDAIDLPLALPCDGVHLPRVIETASMAAFAIATRAPPRGCPARTLPLLL